LSPASAPVCDDNDPDDGADHAGADPPRPRWAPASQGSFYRRDLPADLVPFNSPQGRRYFAEALAANTMECYFPLAEHFITQAEPSYCAISTLAMCLNALGVDPGRDWKLPWRWFSEDMLECCTPMSVIKQKGLTFQQFKRLARCHDVLESDFYAQESDIAHFRSLILRVATAPSVVNPSLASSPHGDPARGGLQAALAVAFSRKALGQTGDGHMSPVGGYHAASDSVLVFEVARFKYPPFWVSVPRLWAAMLPVDSMTGKSRGYCLLSPQTDLAAAASNGANNGDNSGGSPSTNRNANPGADSDGANAKSSNDADVNTSVSKSTSANDASAAVLGSVANVNANACASCCSGANDNSKPDSNTAANANESNTEAVTVIDKSQQQQQSNKPVKVVKRHCGTGECECATR